jgi:hypothetical protein
LAAHRRGGEAGWECASIACNRLGGSNRIGKHLDRWDAEHNQPRHTQPRITSLITSRTITAIVRKAVDFDRKPVLRTEEVECIGRDAMLATELEAAWTQAELTP